MLQHTPDDTINITWAGSSTAEHLAGSQGVESSNLFRSTKFLKATWAVSTVVMHRIRIAVTGVRFSHGPLEVYWTGCCSGDDSSAPVWPAGAGGAALSGSSIGGSTICFGAGDGA